MRVLLKNFETGDFYVKEAYEVSYGIVDVDTEQRAVVFELSDGTGDFGIKGLSPEEGNELVRKVAIQGYIDLTHYEDVYFEPYFDEDEE
ncbi:hypothetical protein [Parasporobacterium paucivorans]|uniref:Uncharacterized protein n=1 Tax=Parasporobacterium paucivorans DSM 15970 TaxID=1122934 RepID=A0A1M6JL91_9FIRM|nr:hypothetical protein [Parasporobacterium paucivorans]SHJ47477.1 hypothetical protein SAMN02745691_02030 [Parasporobacterium paucivorans DSM 15970]